MTDEVDRFFASLAQPRPGQLSPDLRGTIRFTLAGPGGETSWLVTYAGGGARATPVPTGHDADCVVHITTDVFRQLLDGTDHPISLIYRRQVAIEGHLPLYLEFRRLLPVPADSRGPAPAGRAGSPRPAHAEHGS